MTSRFVGAVRAVDAGLLAAPVAVRTLVLVITWLAIVLVSLPHVPRAYVDFSKYPGLQRFSQPLQYGTDTIADMYEAKVVLHDVGDMYTKRQLDQTPLEADTWSKDASAPYPPAVLLVEAGLYALGERTGIGLYGFVLILAVVFLGASCWYCVRTRWYLFPLLYLNFSYFSERFVHVQDGSYLVMLVVVMAALGLARAGSAACEPLMALAITMKVSPLYYAKNVFRMPRGVALTFSTILIAGLVLPVFVWDRYLYIFQFNDGIKGHWYDTIGAAAIAGPFAMALWYIETRLAFDREDRIGWGLVPFALFLGFKMNVARHLLIILLVPDKRGLRTAAAAVGLLLPTALPGLMRFNSALPVTTVILIGVLGYYLHEIGWDVVRGDIRRPGHTLRLLLARR